jgi:hypothetical protein
VNLGIAACKRREFQYHTLGGAMDLRGAMVTFLGCEMERCRLIDEKPANQTVPVLNDPASASVAADREAGRSCGDGCLNALTL